MDKETEYYIFSAKWTRSHEGYLVWWRANCCGHTYFKEAIGIYVCVRPASLANA